MEHLSNPTQAPSLDERSATAVRELNDVLAADYSRAPGLPSLEQARELALIVKNGVEPAWPSWRSTCESSRFLHRLDIFDWTQITVVGEPYKANSGLRLQGFSTRLLSDDNNSVIFINTAHPAGAISSTMAHELGHVVQRRLAPQISKVAFLRGPCVSHLPDESELYADCVVSIMAYSREATAKFVTSSENSSEQQSSIERIALGAYAAIRPEFDIELSSRTMPLEWRLYYLTSMIHYFRLRCTLLATANI
jgi:hypothetical protein